MPGVRVDLLSFKLSVFKVLLGIMCWIFCPMLRIWMEQTGRPIGGAFGILRIAVIMVGVNLIFKGFVESTNTFRNRQLQKLKHINIDDIRSVRQESIGFFSKFKKNDHTFCIFKNEVDVFRIGTDVIYKSRRVIDYKYYYIDDIMNGCVKREKYRDYQEFKRAVNQLNGNRDTFDVISVDKIVIRMK